MVFTAIKPTFGLSVNEPADLIKTEHEVPYHMPPVTTSKTANPINFSSRYFFDVSHAHDFAEKEIFKSYRHTVD